MDEFKIEEYDEIDNPKLKFYKVYRLGICEFDEFVSELNNKYNNFKDELYALQSIMDKIGVVNLPATKFRKIHGKKNDRKDVWEIKTKHLRVYSIKKEPNIFLLLGGIKTKQEEDISAVFRRYNPMRDDLEIIEQGRIDEK